MSSRRAAHRPPIQAPLPGRPATKHWPAPATAGDASGAFLKLLMHQRQVAYALAGGFGNRVQHRGSSDGDGRLADAAPEAAGRYQHRLDLRRIDNVARVGGRGDLVDL